MDYDIISNITVTNHEFFEDFHWVINPHEVVFVVISLVSLCAHTLVIYTIASNKSMRTPTNIYILNLIVFDVLYVITSPANMMIPLHYFFSMDIYCITYDLESIMQTGVIWFFILFSINCSLREEIYLRFIVGTWFVVALACIIFIVCCALDIWTVAAMLLTFFSFALLTVINVVCRVVFRNNNNACKFRHNLVSVYVACWILSWICLFLSIYQVGYSYVLDMTSVIFGGVGYSYGIVNVFALAYFDKKFKLHFLQITRCYKFVYADVGNELNTEVFDVQIDEQNVTVT